MLVVCIVQFLYIIAGYIEVYDILSIGISKFYVLSYPIFFLEQIDNFGVLLPYKMHFFVSLNTEINCEFPLNF
jgi:hypothetical protein